MSFDHLIGHTEIKRQLDKLIKSEKLPSALLFCGPEGVGKGLFARACAATLLDGRALEGLHPDFHEYHPEGKSGTHSIEALREFSQEVFLAPYEGAKKVFIIKAAERMLTYSANALLKTFEEPPLDTLIILVTSHATQLLPTILSRCCQVTFGTLTNTEIALWLEKQHGLEMAKAAAIAQRAHGSLAHAVRLASASEVSLAEKLLFPLLAKKGHFENFGELTMRAVALADAIKDMASTKGSERTPKSTATLTAQQRHALEKEGEGAEALIFATESHLLLEDVAGWCRDIALLQQSSPEPLLWHPGWKAALAALAAKSPPINLDGVLAAVEEATLALQRSNPLAHVLETFFLRVGLLESF